MMSTTAGEGEGGGRGMHFIRNLAELQGHSIRLPPRLRELLREGSKTRPKLRLKQRCSPFRSKPDLAEQKISCD
jgi:hypothetical protein